MIAMQYSYTLPADYDMAIIRQRIASKGPLLDGLPGLAFKAYLYADQDGEHLYAPFYLWRDSDAMHDFLAGPAYAALTQAYGWPVVRSWTLWHQQTGADVKAARYATRGSAAIPPHASLEAWRRREREAAASAMDQGALASVVGVDTATWSVVRLQLWRDEPPAALAGEGVQRYRVGHLSAPS